jgi:Skp family chaperone for outer membrane proteins
MSKSFSLSMILAVAALGLTAPLSAQTRSAVSVAELDAAVAERPAAVREAVQEFLTTERGQEAADRIGMSASELSARVADLDEASLNRIAEQAGISDEVLAGGADTIVITATTAIIILLLVILLVK